MKRIFIVGFALLGLAVTAAGCVKESGDDGGRIRIGGRLPELPPPGYMEEEPILHAGPENLRRFDTRDPDSRKTLIYFFWSGCPECRETTPNVLDAWEQIRNRDDVRLICIARGGAENATREQAVAYWESVAPSIAPTLMPPLFYDEGRRVFDLFAKRNVPRFYLAGSDGIVRWEQAGNVPATELMQRIDNL